MPLRTQGSLAAATKEITPATRKAGTRVAGRVSEGGSVFVWRHARRRIAGRVPLTLKGFGTDSPSRHPRARPSREPPTQTAARWSLPLTLTLTGTQADSTEAPLGFFATCEEMRC